MINVKVLTATRAEYGLLKPVIEKLNSFRDMDVKLLVTGTHLSAEFGNTEEEINDDDFDIEARIDILNDNDTPKGISYTMATAIQKFADYFSRTEIDLLIVLGDRYETLAVCCAATNCQIPIVHIGGGATTEGAVDECFRHSITKMSYLHFASTEKYAKRIIQLGESPERVYFVGSLGVENAKKVELLSKKDLSYSLCQDLDTPYFIVTFHPVTLETDGIEKQLYSLIDACCDNNYYNYIFTKANADTGGRWINAILDDVACHERNIKCYASLGMKKYLSAVQYSKGVIGNSSSGILEAPALHRPTINIGDRQKGRIQCESIVNCSPNKEDISNAIKKIVSNDFLDIVEKVVSPYYKENTSETIATVIYRYMKGGQINLKKKFYDINIEV